MVLQNKVPNHELISIQDSFQTQVSWLHRLIHTERHQLVQFQATFGWSQFQYLYCSVSLLFFRHAGPQSIESYCRKEYIRL